jgi:hypothetical protein
MIETVVARRYTQPTTPLVTTVKMMALRGTF